MLAPILFLLLLVFTLAGAVLENGLIAAKIAVQTSVSRAADTAIVDAVDEYTAALAAFVAEHGTDGPWPEAVSHSYPRPVCTAAGAAGGCPNYSYVVDARITQASGGGARGAAGADPARNLQSAAIDEQRVSALVTATLTSPDGSVAGRRTRALTYRVFSAAPYAVVSGAGDMSGPAGLPGNAQGDSAGGTVPAASDSHVPAPAAAAMHDTRIHVVLACQNVIAGVRPFINDTAPAGNDGLPWGNANGQAHETVCSQTPSPADAFRNETWRNGDAAASGWSR